MLAKRIIPCLDVKDGKVVKGVHFADLRDAGDPVENGRIYSDEGADELVFLDISATLERRKTITALVKAVATELSIPFTVGGGIRSLDDINILLQSGADKVSINTEAFKNPALVSEAAKKFGSQCIVAAVDAKKSDGGWRVRIASGTKTTGFDAIEWAKELERLGAGEILLTSIDADGTQRGYDIFLTRAIADAVRIPVIASGGAGTLEHLHEVLVEGRASAVLMASILHFKQFSIRQIKQYLQANNIPVRA
jgi:cyclase